MTAPLVAADRPQGERRPYVAGARERLSPTSETLREHRGWRESGLGAILEREKTEEDLRECRRQLLEEQGRRRSAEAALTDQETRLATFGHDLKNLLNLISLTAELGSRDKGRSFRSLGDIQRTVRRMDCLVSNLLDFSRMKAGTFHMALDRGNASDVVTEAVEIFRPMAVAKSISLEAMLSDTTLPARIDADGIFQVLSNLICNAIDVTPVGGSIRVSAGEIDAGVQIAVRDFGKGIAEADLERVFEPYVQLDRAGRRGLGLGLFISRSIVQAHGGRIWVESKMGAGSKFSFTIPGARRESKRVAPRALLAAAAV